VEVSVVVSAEEIGAVSAAGSDAAGVVTVAAVGAAVAVAEAARRRRRGFPSPSSGAS